MPNILHPTPIPVGPVHTGPILRTAVTLAMPKDPLFVGSYVSVGVTIVAAGLTFDDLEFSVLEGPAGGAISLCRDATFDLAHPSILLLAGYKPGMYTLQVHKKGTIPATLLYAAHFTLTNLWTDRTQGPSKWFNGVIPLGVGEPTWGGGPSGVPQNYNVFPAVGTRKIGVLFFDTTDGRFPTAAAQQKPIFDKWQQMVSDGFTGPDGIARSVKSFYKEVSYSNLTADVTIFRNVISLSSHFTDLFFFNSNGEWQPQGELATTCITQASDPSGLNLDLTPFDMLVLVTQPVSVAPASPPAGTPAVPWSAWPFGGFSTGTSTSFGNVNARGVSMPNNWGDLSPLDPGSVGRTIYETLTHELGHTLGLPDEYTPIVGTQNLGDVFLPGQSANLSWDPMCWEQPWPHFTLAHRLQLGWVQPAWLRLYNFQGNVHTQVDDTITLSPIENGAPPAGSFAGVEVRIGDGENYYFEHRTPQVGQLGDQSLTTTKCVVGVDVVESPATAPIARPDMLLLPQHSDDNGAVLTTGQFYHEIDNTSATFPADFRVDVLSTSAAGAKIRIRYEVIGKPDPSIRPWPSDSNHPYQSPDIEVQNPRSIASPAMFANTPWSGHDNTVIGSVTNRGTLSAPGVVANFYVKDYTITGAPETFLGFDKHDINPGATVKFTTHWTPPVPADPSTSQHYCIIVRIDQYQTPTSPAVMELTGANNEAQSNYTSFISASGSPPSRERSTVTLFNPYPKPTMAYIGFKQSTPVFRSYVEHDWVFLKPHEKRQVGVMFEYAADLPAGSGALIARDEKGTKYQNHIALIGYLEDPTDRHLHGPRRIAGVSATVFAAEGTKFEKILAEGNTIRGMVATVSGAPMHAGHVILSYGAKPELTFTVAVTTGGSFSVTAKSLPAVWLLTFVPPTGYGECVWRNSQKG